MKAALNYLIVFLMILIPNLSKQFRQLINIKVLILIKKINKKEFLNKCLTTMHQYYLKCYYLNWNKYYNITKFLCENNKSLIVLVACTFI